MTRLSPLLLICLLAAIAIGGVGGCEKPPLDVQRAVSILYDYWLRPSFVDPNVAELEARMARKGFFDASAGPDGEFHFQSSEADEFFQALGKCIRDMKHGAAGATPVRDEPPECETQGVREAFHAD